VPGVASPFGRRVLEALGRVPPGRVVTYGDLARLAGRPGAARAVGSLMRTAAAPGLPYHRVVLAGGRVGGYGGAPGLKAALLRAEGVRIRGQRIMEFRARRIAPPRGVPAARSAHAGAGRGQRGEPRGRLTR